LIFNRCRRAHAGAGSLPLICPYADWRGRPCGAAVVVFASLPWSPLIPARRLLDSLVIVGRRFSDGDRRRATRIIIVSVGPVRIRPSLEAVLLAGPQRNIHDPCPYVAEGGGDSGRSATRADAGLSACCRWIRSTTRSQDFACCGCDPRAAARALWRAMVAASPPCTSIMSRASDAASAPPGSASSSATSAVTGALAREQAPRNLLQTGSGARSVEQTNF